MWAWPCDDSEDSSLDVMTLVVAVDVDIICVCVGASELVLVYANCNGRRCVCVEAPRQLKQVLHSSVLDRQLVMVLVMVLAMEGIRKIP